MLKQFPTAGAKREAKLQGTFIGACSKGGDAL